jgi:hypothetical protein
VKKAFMGAGDDEDDGRLVAKTQRPTRVLNEAALPNWAKHAVMALPAHSTKHIPLLSHSFHGSVLNLAQRSDGISNGNAFSLGGGITPEVWCRGD